MNIWWVIVIAIISVPVFFLVRWILSIKNTQEDIERAGGFNEWSKHIEDRIAQSDEEIRRKEEIIRLSDEVLKRSDVFSNTLSTLEQQIKQNLFSDAELAEIAKDKEHSNDLSLLSTRASEQIIKPMEQKVRLIKEQTKLIEKGTVFTETPISKKNDDKKRTLDAEIETVNKKITACNEQLFASYAKIEQWVELGKTRAAKQAPGA